MMRDVLLLILPLLQGCVTPDAAVSSRDGLFGLQCRENGKIATSEVSLVECDVVNRSEKPVRLVMSGISTPDGFGGEIATPGQIAALQESSDPDSGVRAVFSLLVVAAAVAGGTDSGGAVGAGGVAVIATLPGGGKGPARNTEAFGSQHFLAGGFDVPGGKSVTKSAIFILGTDKMPPVEVKLCFVEPAIECITAPVEPWVGRSRVRAGQP